MLGGLVVWRDSAAAPKVRLECTVQILILLGFSLCSDSDRKTGNQANSNLLEIGDSFSLPYAGPLTVGKFGGMSGRNGEK